jgi:iron(III) transport system substrate-binding protein
MKTLLLALLGAAISWQPAFARAPSELELQLLEGARKEEKLVFYTTMDLPQTVDVAYQFVQKYPFLRVDLHPAETETLVKKVQSEARTGGSVWDVLIGGGGSFQPLFDEKLIASYHSRQRQSVSDALVDGAGHWSAYYINPYVLGYNTTAVKREEVPNKYDDLLDPRWKGSRIAIDSTAHGLLRGLAAAWGEDKALRYLRRLADQRPVMSRASITAVESIRTGSVLIAIARAPVIQGFKKDFGAPIDWVSLEPTVAQIDSVMVSAQSPHPNAARLFVDFALSEEGQSVLAEVQQIPVRRDMEAQRLVENSQWSVERPDKHVEFHKTVRLFRQIFGMP